MVPHKIKETKAIRPYLLRIAWASGKTSDVDVSGVIEKFEGFSSLLKESTFMKATADEWGWGVVWPGDIEMAADRLYQMAKEQAGKAFPAEKFRAWMKRNDLSLTTAALALGITRRTVASYSSGVRPIPIYISLACHGYESLHKDKSRKKAA